MNRFLVCVWVVSVAIFSSCSHNTNAVKAGYDTSEESWLTRNVPGISAVSKIVPPPTDARTQWDRWQQKKNERSIENPY